jgi:hypothetical protein
MSTISSGTTLTTALVQTGDTTGDLVIKTGASNTTAMTISGTDQSVVINGSLTANVNVATLTGIVAVTNGGTGLSSAGTAGNVLTSNGTAWSSTAPAPSAGSFQAIATGSLANGSAVIVNADGTVSVITGQGANYSSPTVFNAGGSEYIGACYDSTNNKVVVAYTDLANSGYGTAVVGTLSGTTISFGTPVVLNSATSYFYGAPTFDSTNGKIVISYVNAAGGYELYAIVGTVSGTSISFGSGVSAAGGFFTTGATTFDSANSKIVVVYRSATDGLGYGKVGTVSGTSISFGSATAFSGGVVIGTQTVTFDSNAGKVVTAYTTASVANIVIGTVSGTSISFGTPVAFNGANTATLPAITFDSTNNKIVTVYANSANSSYGTAIVGTVSGTSISFGTPVVFAAFTNNYLGITFDSISSKIVVTLKATVTAGTAGYGAFLVGAVSGTSISFGNLSYFATTVSNYIYPTFATTSNKVFVGYSNDSSSDYGTAISFTTPFSNMTTENFIGFSNAAYTNGQTATIQTVGSIDDAQTSLTAGQSYYVIPSGTLSTQEDTDIPVFAGTAVSATKIIIKG